MPDVPPFAPVAAFVPPWNRSRERPMSDKLSETISPADFGADPEEDATRPLQDAIDCAQETGRKLVITETYRTTEPLRITAGIHIECAQAMRDWIKGTWRGAWIHADHEGKAIEIGADQQITNISIMGLGIRRTQPAPVHGWAPGAFDYDIDAKGSCDVVLRDLFLLNPTKAIKFWGGGGRLVLDNMRGQPLQEGVHIDGAYDVCRIDKLHAWPYWSTDPEVLAYTSSQADLILSGRNDNPIFVSIFGFGYRSNLRLYRSAEGRTSKLKVASMDCDYAKRGIWIDSSVNNGCSVQVENFTHQGDAPDSSALLVEGNAAMVQIGNFECSKSYSNAIRIVGQANNVKVGVPVAANYDFGLVGNAAFHADAGNKLIFGTESEVAPAPGSSAPRFSGDGHISSPDWRSFAPQITSDAGAVESSANMEWRLQGGVVTANFSIHLTGAGTGEGALHMTLPFGAPRTFATGQGREVAVHGQSLSVTVAPGQAQASIVTGDNRWPGAPGALIVGSISYPV